MLTGSEHRVQSECSAMTELCCIKGRGLKARSKYHRRLSQLNGPSHYSTQNKTFGWTTFRLLPNVSYALCVKCPEETEGRRKGQETV